MLKECDKAIASLPESYASADETKRRATKWAALALKSRAALFAASLCKYWSKAPLSGEAVTKKLVGMSAADANSYYEACVSSSEAIINSSKFSLYKPSPANPAEAAKNLESLFTDPNIASSEVIFMKGYGKIGEPLGHDYDGWNNPNQIGGSFPYRGRTNPILELVDKYEDYTHPGHPSPIITTMDGKVGGTGGYNSSTSYRHFDKPEDIFANKDARFFASIIYPNAIWKSTKIIIQGGVVRHDGSLMNSRGSYEYNGTTYYTYGKEQPNQYSGFDGSANDTRSGFLLRKFLNESWEINAWEQSTTDYADMRYAEVLLNYAEAVVESSRTPKYTKAAQLLNSIRFRAAHTVAIPLTLDNVLRERKVELAFENKEYWDLIRRREFHVIFNNRVKTALIPMIDLRGDTPKYIFVRKKVAGANPNTARLRDYYRSIPGTAGNGVIQNPEY